MNWNINFVRFITYPILSFDVFIISENKFVWKLLDTRLRNAFIIFDRRQISSVARLLRHAPHTSLARPIPSRKSPVILRWINLNLGQLDRKCRPSLTNLPFEKRHFAHASVFIPQNPRTPGDFSGNRALLFDENRCAAPTGAARADERDRAPVFRVYKRR